LLELNFESTILSVLLSYTDRKNFAELSKTVVTVFPVNEHFCHFCGNTSAWF